MRPMYLYLQTWNYLCEESETVNTVTAVKLKCRNILLKKHLVVDPQQIQLCHRENTNMWKDVYFAYSLTF